MTGGILSEQSEPLMMFQSMTVARLSLATQRLIAFHPRSGLLGGVNEDLVLRARWSTGFKPPNFTDLFNVDSRITDTGFVFDDPIGGVAFGFEEILGGNPDLEPETSETVSAGLSWTPSSGALKGLELKADYNETVIEDGATTFDGLRGRIPVDLLYSLDQLITRDPVTNVITRLDRRPFNIAEQTAESITYQVMYSFDTQFGVFRPSLTYVDNLEQSLTIVPGAEKTDSLGTLRGLDDYLIVGSLGYDYKDVSANLRVEHIPSYKNEFDEDFTQTVDSLTTVDLNVQYQFNEKVRASLGTYNLLDQEPPFVLNQLSAPYDPSRWDTRGRVLYVDLAYSF